jgi:hypothetical protein
MGRLMHLTSLLWQCRAKFDVSTPAPSADNLVAAFRASLWQKSSVGKLWGLATTAIFG